MNQVHEDTTSVLFAIKSAALFILAAVFIWWRGNRKSGLPPGPLGLPLVGYLPFLGKFPPKHITLLQTQYGEIFSLKLGTRRYVVLNKYEDIHEALVKRGSVFSGRERYELMDKFGNHHGIVYRDYGDTLKRLRKFGVTTLKGFGVGKKSMEERVNEEIGYLLQEIQAKGGEPFDIVQDLSNAVANVIGSIVNGRRYEYDDDTLKTFLYLLARRYGGKGIADRLRALEIMPQLRYLPGFRTAYKALEEQLTYAMNMFNELIQEHKDTYDSNNIRDFTDAFLKEMNEDRKNHFTPEILNVVIRDLFHAGTETTSTTLRWCFLYLATHPEVQGKIRKEINAEFGVSGSISMDKRSELPLTCSFIHEIQRTKLAVPMVPHKTTEDVVFRGFSLPKNTAVLVNMWSVHHDPENFANPHEFRPDRFLDADGKFAKHDRVIPYSIGPRYCLGMHLAEMEVFMFLTGILRNFRVVEDENDSLPSFGDSVVGLFNSPLPYKAKFLLT